jgi:hypothetical protein
MSITNDPGIPTLQDLRDTFGTSKPRGNIQINSTKCKRSSMETMYCTGDAYIFGCVKTPLKICDKITTEGGKNLILDPSGPSIDFTNHTLINVGGVTVSVGLPNQVIINDPFGVLAGENQLATVRGGTGQNSSAATGVAKVTAGVWSFAPLTAADFGVIANMTVTTLTTNTIISPGDLTITPAGGDVFFGPTIIHQSVVAGSDSVIYTAQATTVNNITTQLFILTTTSGPKGTVYTINSTISLGDATGGTDTGTYTFVGKGKNLLGVVSVSGMMQSGSILDGVLAGTSIGFIASGTGIRVRITGLAATTIQWTGRFEVTSQEF